MGTKDAGSFAIKAGFPACDEASIKFFGHYADNSVKGEMLRCTY